MSLDRIELTGLEFFAYHGCLPEERLRGQAFIVDVVMSLDLSIAGVSNDLKKTVNYTEVVDLVEAIVTGEPVNLIETIAESIAEGILKKFTLVECVEVKIHKPQAPIKRVFKDICVVIKRGKICQNK